MKKIMFAFCALLLGFFVASCDNKSKKDNDDEKDGKETVDKNKSKGNAEKEDSFEEDDEDVVLTSSSKDYVEAVKEMMNEVSANWSANDWSDFMERYAKLAIEFMESNPSEEVYRAFTAIEPNMSNFSEEAQKTAFEGIMKFASTSPLFQKVQDMQEELEKKFK